MSHRLPWQVTSDRNGKYHSDEFDFMEVTRFPGHNRHFPCRNRHFPPS